MRAIHVLRIFDVDERCEHDVVKEVLQTYPKFSTIILQRKLRTCLEHLRRHTGQSSVLDVIRLRHLPLVRLIERVRVEHDQTESQHVRLIYAEASA
jgi:hypothetical protein